MSRAPFSFYEFFAGGGMAGLGLGAGWTCAFANDFDPVKAATYRANFPNLEPSGAADHFHEGDVYNPIEPGTLFTRLQTIGFDHITVAMQWSVHFRARKPPVGER